MRHGIVLTALLLAGCATAIRGTTETVEIHSSPPGATARTSLGHQCVTPCKVEVARKQEFSVSYELAGFRPATVEVKTAIAPGGAAAFAGNTLFITGMAADALSGATLNHEPNPVSATLERR